MQHATRHTPAASENEKIAALRRILDPVERAARIQVFINGGRQTLRAAEHLRDDAIREARTSRRVTIDQLADEIKVRRNVVVDALRTPRESR